MDAENRKQITFYKITSEVGNKIYIGSTGKPILQRFSNHKSNYKRFKNPNPNKPKVSKVTSFDLFDEYGVEKCEISELSSKMCNKSERDEAENQYIDQFKADNTYECVNKMRAGVYSKKPKNWKIVRCACGHSYVGSVRVHEKESHAHKQYVTININITINK